MRKSNSERILLPFTKRERWILAAKSVMVVLILDYFFYQSWLAVFPLAAAGFLYCRMEKKILYEKKKDLALEQFKELMLLVSTGQKAGYSADNAFLSSYQDMKVLYGSSSSVCIMIDMLKAGKENHIPFTELWKQIGEKIHIEEIREFADIYEISHKSSGNVAAVMEKTAEIIVRKIETEKEIAVMISAKRLEQKIMNMMPFLIMLYISIVYPGYFEPLYHSLPGVLIMSVCLLVYLCAYGLSVYIISIKI
ncbi:MAG: hypothetical protein PUG54_05970 [Firmicutes bacterium]|nr:hypothetical protein [Bacillota bacterium]